MFKKALIVSVTLAVTSCVSSPVLNNVDSSSTNSQIAQLTQADMFLANKYKQNESDRNLQPFFDSSVSSYRSLKIDNSSFSTKGLTGDAAVSFMIGTKRYALTAGYMTKLRLVLGQYKPGADVLKAIFTTKAFEKLSAASGVLVAGVTATPALTNGDQTAFTSAYTNSTDEAAFTTLLKTYSSVSMPNYLNDMSGAFSTAFPTTDTIQIVVNTTGIRNNFLKAINARLINDSNSGVLTSDEIKELNTYNVVDDALGVVAPATPVTLAAKLPNTGEKAFLTSILNNNPFADDVVLLDATGTNIISRDIQLYYGETQAVPQTVREDALKNFGMMNREAATFTGTPPVSTNYVATPSGTNYSGAAALLGAKYYTTNVSIPTTYAALHTALRNLHTAGQATTFTPALAAPTKATYFRTLTVTGASTTVSVTPTAAEFGEFTNALSNVTATTYKLPKSTTLTTLKFKTSIESFFSGSDTATRALIVPATRSAVGALTFGASSATSHHVAIFAAKVAPTGTYSYTVFDPGYNSASGASFYSIGTSSPASTLVTSLYNYAGVTMVGVKF